MALASGTKLGAYEIQSPLGAGGMGEVYRARDTRLDRIIAIKSPSCLILGRPRPAAPLRAGSTFRCRQLVKTLEMRDPTGGFGLTRALTTPDGRYFAYGTLRQLSELYVLQGLH
jgi:serine/threonine protein kinase